MWEDLIESMQIGCSRVDLSFVSCVECVGAGERGDSGEVAAIYTHMSRS